MFHTYIHMYIMMLSCDLSISTLLSILSVFIINGCCILSNVFSASNPHFLILPGEPPGPQSFQYDQHGGERLEE